MIIKEQDHEIRSRPEHLEFGPVVGIWQKMRDDDIEKSIWPMPLRLRHKRELLGTPLANWSPSQKRPRKIILPPTSPPTQRREFHICLEPQYPTRRETRIDEHKRSIMTLSLSLYRNKITSRVSETTINHLSYDDAPRMCIARPKYHMSQCWWQRKHATVPPVCLKWRRTLAELIYLIRKIMKASAGGARRLLHMTKMAPNYV